MIKKSARSWSDKIARIQFDEKFQSNSSKQLLEAYTE